MRVKNIFLLLAVVLLQRNSSAQEAKAPQTWSLEQCIEYALQNNIQIKQQELNAELSDVTLTQSKANLLPSLNGNASHTYNYGRTIDKFTNEFTTQQVLSENFSLSADVTLFSGWQNINTIQQNRYSFMAKKFDLDKMRNDVSLNIASTYLQVLFAMENRDNAQNQLGITTATVERTKKLVDAGSAARGTLLDIQSQYAVEELNLTNAQNQLDIATLSLAQLLNLPSIEGFAIVKPELNIGNENLLTATPTQIYANAVNSLPEVKSAEYGLKSAEKAVDVAWGGLSPRLSMSATYYTGYSDGRQRLLTAPAFQGYKPDGSFTSAGDTVYSPSFSNPTYENIPFSDQFKDNANKSIGFNLTVPLFNRFQVKSSIDRARIQRLNAELSMESTKLQLQKNIQQAYADASAGLKKYISSQKALEATEESFKYTQQKFDVGMVNTTDFNTSKNKLNKAQSDVLQAKFEYIFKLKVLDFYQGKPLKL